MQTCLGYDDLKFWEKLVFSVQVLVNLEFMSFCFLSFYPRMFSSNIQEKPLWHWKNKTSMFTGIWLAQKAHLQVFL